jgi:hypothetical protein
MQFVEGGKEDQKHGRVELHDPDSFKLDSNILKIDFLFDRLIIQEIGPTPTIDNQLMLRANGHPQISEPLKSHIFHFRLHIMKRQDSQLSSHEQQVEMLAIIVHLAAHDLVPGLAVFQFLEGVQLVDAD